MPFVANLHTHSSASLHDGFATFDGLVQKAKELGYEALALTDHGTVSGLFQFYEACKKEGIKPLLGCEMYFVHDINLKESTMYHMLFLAKDLDGYKNLMRLNKFAHENFYKKPRINMSAIAEFHEGLICTTACLAGILRQDDPLEDMHELSCIFGRDLYVEVHPHDMDDQKAYNWKAYEFAKTHGHKVIVTIDSHYVRKEDAPYHRLWLNLGDESDYYPTQTYYLMSTEEVDDYMMKFHGFSREDVDSFYANVKEIVNKCNVEIPVGGQHYPNFCADPEAYIRKRCNEGYMEKKVGKWTNKKEHIDRINYEIGMLGKTGYWNYMCIIDDMMHHCKKVGIRTGLGRGSVVGSDVAYFMGITKVDPLKYNLLFERFCNPERVTSPDVDVDVQTSRRDELIEYIKSRYGEVFQVRTFGYIKPKSACRRACESLGYEPAKTNELCKNIVDVDDLQDKKAREIAKHFMGHIINYSTHASAVIVCPDEITNYTSIERQKSTKTGEYDYVVCYEFHDCEAMGLLKLDILGLQHLDVIDRVVKQVGVDYDSIPPKDEKTCRLLNQGKTDGVFQSESAGFTNLLNRLKVEGDNECIVANALYRPGTLDSGITDEYILRRAGKKPITYPAPELEKAFKETYGLPIYQEEIMQGAQVLCGYSLGQADNVRRIIGRKIKEEMGPCIADMKEAAKKIGTPEEAVEKFASVVEASASYLFNHSHAAAYGITAWRSAYLKAHYPIEFMASFLNQKCKDKDFPAYVKATKDMGITILPPELGADMCQKRGTGIQLGTNCIKGVGSLEPPINKNSLTEIINQYPSNKLEALIKGGALDYLKVPRSKMIGSIKPVKNYYATQKSALDAIQRWKANTKFKPEYIEKKIKHYEEIIKNNVIEWYDDSSFDDIDGELKVFGFSFQDPLKHYDLSLVNNKTTFAGYVSKFKKLHDRNGNPMAFIDLDNGLSFAMFHKQYQELKEGKPYLIGAYQGSRGMIINSVRPLRRLDN